MRKHIAAAVLTILATAGCYKSLRVGSLYWQYSHSANVESTTPATGLQAVADTADKPAS